MNSKQILEGIAFRHEGPIGAPFVVLGHALGVDSGVWEQVTQILSTNYQVIRWDQPGHGGSYLISEPTEIGNVAGRVLDGLRQLGVEKFHVGGISLGGMVSLSMAAMNPQRVLSLAVLDAGPKLEPAQGWVDRAALVRSNGMSELVDGTMERWFTPSFLAGGGQAKTRDSFLNCNPEGYAQCCEIIATSDLTGSLSQILMPTLLIAGRDDPGVTQQKLATLSKQIPGAESNFVIIENARHLSCVEQPVLVADTLIEHFIESCEKR